MHYYNWCAVTGLIVSAFFKVIHFPLTIQEASYIKGSCVETSNFFFCVSSQAVFRCSLCFGTVVAARLSCSQKSTSACVTWMQRRRNKPKLFITLLRACFYNPTEYKLLPHERKKSALQLQTNTVAANIPQHFITFSSWHKLKIFNRAHAIMSKIVFEGIKCGLCSQAEH